MVSALAIAPSWNTNKSFEDTGDIKLTVVASNITGTVLARGVQPFHYRRPRYQPYFNLRPPVT